jgi:XTP/dITP diphosphohydrolase
LRPRRLVVATGNPGKLREFQSLLERVEIDGSPVELTSLAELGLPSPAETGTSFLANATLKARHAAALSGLAAIADDSGLEVDALGGAPGIYSARYAFPPGSEAHGKGAEMLSATAVDAANNAKLLRELDRKPLEQRAARYRCALVFIDAPEGASIATAATPLIAEGVWEGFILDAPLGSGGFGYDPYFWLPELARSAAQLEPAEKNRLSHRGRALRLLRQLLSARR